MSRRGGVVPTGAIPGALAKNKRADPAGRDGVQAGQFPGGEQRVEAVRAPVRAPGDQSRRRRPGQPAVRGQHGERVVAGQPVEPGQAELGPAVAGQLPEQPQPGQPAVWANL